MARSYMAGMTLRFARSPEAPKRTTVQGSTAPPYAEPEPPVSPAMVSSSAKLRPVQVSDAASARKLYLNPILSKLRTQLLRVLMVNGVHPQAPGGFQIERPVINEKTLFRLALCDFQRHAKNHFLGLPGSKVTGAEENEKIIAKVEGFNAVLVEL